MGTHTAPAETSLSTTIPGTGQPRSAEAAAALRAAVEFARTHHQSVLIPLLGTSDSFMSHEELMAKRAADSAEHE